jgi:hypothetical protein
MSRRVGRIVLLLALAGGVVAGSAGPLAAQVKPGAKANEPPPKPEPVVIKLQKADRGRMGGQEVMVITGTDMLTGKPRQFGVENERPQNPNDKPKYEPRARVADAVKPLKEGDLLKIEPKAASMNYNSPAGDWVDRAEAYKLTPNEDQPGAFVLFDSYSKQEGGVDVYVITLVKYGRYFDCYAPMVPDETGKKMVPDPAITKIADGVKKREVVEATVAPKGPALFVTSIDPYQDPKAAKFGKLVDADVNGQKGHAVELEQDGQTVTLLLPGKLVGKRYSTDLSLLNEAKRTKPGTAVMVRTRDIDGKQYLRQMLLAPKEPKAKEASKSGK